MGLKRSAQSKKKKQSKKKTTKAKRAKPKAARPPAAVAVPPPKRVIIGAGGDLPPAESPELAALINYVRDGRCVLFVGAGLSRAAGLPSWHQLMERLVSACGPVRNDEGSAEEMRALLDQRKYPELAGHCRELLGTRAFYDNVRQGLTRTGDVPAFYESIVSTPYACIVTTNFDTLLEDAYAQWDTRGIPKTPTGADLAQQGTLLLDGAFFVLKAHGDVGDPQSMIFTAEDYRRVIHANPAFQSMLSSILLTHAVLFVGYSLNDPNFRLLLDSQLTIFNEEVPPRYAVMTDVGKAEQEILWRTSRIRVLPYAKGQHEEVGRFLNVIAAKARRTATPAAGTASGETTAEAAASAPAVAVRKTLGLPVALDSATLAIRGRQDRFDIDLYRQNRGVRELVFSASGRRPPLQGIQERVAKSMYQWTLADVSRIGAFLLQDDFEKLEGQLAQLPESTVVVLSCSQDAEVLPWEWIVVEGMPLCLRHPVTRSSVVVSHKARGLRYVGQPLRALVIGDTGNGDAMYPSLVAARKEAAEVKKVIETESEGAVVTLLQEKEATYERVIREVERGDYDIVHFAGISAFDERESFLVMNDGYVRNSELVSLLNRRPPAFMMFNSVLTAFVPPVEGFSGIPASASGTTDWPMHVNPRGFNHLAARTGVSAFIGVFHYALMDESAAKMATAIYTELLRGTPVAPALLNARKQCIQYGDVAACFYSLNGHPHLRMRGDTTR